MHNKQSRAFIFTIICIALLPHITIGMKRQGSPLEQSITKRQTIIPANPLCPHLPEDCWTDIAICNLSNLKPLRQLSRPIYRALKEITIDSLSNTIAKNPTAAQGISKNFYICTKLLYKFGKENNKHLFNIVWNSQSVNDKGIRSYFVEMLKKCEPWGTVNKLTKQQYFNSPHLLNIGGHKIKLLTCQLTHYLYIHLSSDEPQLLHLATCHCLYRQALENKLTLSGDIFKRSTRLSTTILSEAYQHSTAQCFQILLDYDVKQENIYLDPSLLLILFKEGLIFGAQKIDLILQYYNQQKIDDVINIVNINYCYQNFTGTPLMFALSFFKKKQIYLKELIDIINVLLKHGANPNIQITDGSTIFDKITNASAAWSNNPITQKEAAIIVDCLKGKTQ